MIRRYASTVPPHSLHIDIHCDNGPTSISWMSIDRYHAQNASYLIMLHNLNRVHRKQAKCSFPKPHVRNLEDHCQAESLDKLMERYEAPRVTIDAKLAASQLAQPGWLHLLSSMYLNQLLHWMYIQCRSCGSSAYTVLISRPILAWLLLIGMLFEYITFETAYTNMHPCPARVSELSINSWYHMNAWSNWISRLISRMSLNPDITSIAHTIHRDVFLEIRTAWLL